MGQGYLYLCLSILSSSIIALGFKEVQRHKLHLLQVITVNYLVCVMVGATFSPYFIQNIVSNEVNILPLALFEGMMFISIFFLMGRVTQIIGVGYMTVLNKMTVIIPVLFSYWYYHEPINALKGIGIVFALLAVLLINQGRTTGESIEGSKRLAVFVFAPILFIGGGIIDVVMKIFKTEYSQYVANENDFLIFLFGTAGLIGLAISLVSIVQGKAQFSYRNVLGGIAIGVPNYFSMYFLVKALEYFEGPFFFPVNNIGVVVVATLAGILFYKEKYTLINYVGMVIAIGAILMIMFSEWA